MSTGKKVVIVGGGPAALATAFDLSQFDDKYDVTVYTMGWRLGGKCASSRNSRQFHRNEEHGLHLPMGFYENFFDQIRCAYDIVARPPGGPLSSFEAAFRRRSTLTLTELLDDQTWTEWQLQFPKQGGVPGERARARMRGQELQWMTLADCIRGIATWLTTYVANLLVEADVPQRDVNDLVEAINGALAFIENFALGAIAAFVQVVTGVAYDVVFPALEKAGLEDSAPRKAWVLLELGLAVLNGLIALVNANRQLSSLDGKDFTEWLDGFARGGRLTEWSRSSSPLRMVYELVFAYEGGDSSKPRLAAGVALRGLLRLVFDYADTVAFDLGAGMGDVVIQPYFEAISKSNPDARFVFFSRLVGVTLSPDKKRVHKLRFAVQATPKEPPYRPLIEVNEVRAWPAAPKYCRLVEGDQLQASDELPDGGFDLESDRSSWPNVGEMEVDVSDAIVVLAIPPTAMQGVTTELGDASPMWAQMLADVTGVSTIAFQAWTVSDAAALGWPKKRSQSDESLLIGAYSDPLGTIMDMSQVIPFESWPGDSVPGCSLYFCGPFLPPLPDPGAPSSAYLSKARTVAVGLTREWATQHLSFPFPGLVKGGALAMAEFVAPRMPETGDRFAAQYFRASVNAGEQYITSFPKTITSRMRPDQTPFENLLIAGDWTKNGMDAGALEAAVTSGRIAARKIRAKDYLIYGEGDWL